MARYRSYQRYNQHKFPKHIGANRRDSNNNIIYYESLSSIGQVIKHYQNFDKLNRKVSYYDSEGNYSDITYYNNTTNIKSEKEIFIDKDHKALRTTNYDKNGIILNKTIISGNTRYYQEYKYPYTKKTTYSPFEKVIL